jgi:hypothetical protein
MTPVEIYAAPQAPNSARVEAGKQIFRETAIQDIPNMPANRYQSISCQLEYLHLSFEVCRITESLTLSVHC